MATRTFERRHGSAVSPEETRRCDGWEAAGQPLRAAVAWRIYQGKGQVLSDVTGVPLAVLESFVETGVIDSYNGLALSTIAL